MFIIFIKKVAQYNKTGLKEIIVYFRQEIIHTHFCKTSCSDQINQRFSRNFIPKYCTYFTESIACSQVLRLFATNGSCETQTVYDVLSKFFTKRADFLSLELFRNNWLTIDKLFIAAFGLVQLIVCVRFINSCNCFDF